MCDSSYMAYVLVYIYTSKTFKHMQFPLFPTEKR